MAKNTGKNNENKQQDLAPTGNDQGSPSQALAPPSKLATLRDGFARKRSQISAALPKMIDPNRFMRIVMSTLKADSKLLDCTTESIFRAVLASAQVGLEPDPVLGHAYLIPFWNSRARSLEASFLIGYKGLIELARRSGQVISISAQVVYSGDVFEFEYGLDEDRFIHKPALGIEDRGEPIAVWAKAALKDGGRAFEVMSVSDVNKIRDMGNAKNSKGDIVGPWRDHWDEMARKTAVRKLAKYLPLSSEFQRAAALDEAIELGHATESLFPEIDGEVIDGEAEPTGTASKLDNLRSRADKVKEGSQATEGGEGAEDKGNPEDK